MGQVTNLFGFSAPAIFSTTTKVDEPTSSESELPPTLLSKTSEEVITEMKSLASDMDTEFEDVIIVHRDDHRSYPEEVMSLKDSLQNRSPWKCLHSEQLGFLVSLMGREVRAQGDRVFQEGALSPALTVVMSGELDLYKTVRILNRFQQQWPR